MDERRMALNFCWKTKQVILTIILLTFWFAYTATAAPVLVVSPDSPVVASCLAFGAAPGSGVQDDPESGFIPTSPYMGFIYRDIPAFELSPGDVLAFDLGAVNDFDVAVDIEMVATTENGGTIEAAPFTKVVSNTYDPLKARGDTTIDNFDLRFIVDSAYSFPGGGLIIRFSNGSPTYREDNESCDQVGVVAMSTDASGFFVQAFWGDSDGVSPWSPQPPISLSEEIIGGFQVIEGPTVLLASDTLDQSGEVISSTTVSETVTYRVTAQNPDLSDAAGVVVTVTLDDLVTFVQTSQNPPATAIFDAGPPATVEWSVGSLTAGAEAILEVELDVPFDAGGQLLTNFVEITASDAPFNSGLTDKSDVSIEPAIDIVGEMLDLTGNAITAVKAGEPFVYHIVASNPSLLDGTGIDVTATLSQDLVFQQAESIPPTNPVYNPGPPETIVWTVGNLTAGDEATLDIDVIAAFASSGEDRTGVAAVTAPSQGDDVITLISIDTAIDISSETLDESGANISTARTGDTISYEIIVRNDSEALATGLEVDVALSEYLEFLQLTSTPPTTATHTSGTRDTISWNIGDLSSGGEVALVVEMDVLFAASGQLINNLAEITAADAPLLVGTRTNSNISIEDAIELTVKTLNSSGAETSTGIIDDRIDYQINVINNGGVAATGLEITTILDSSLAFVQVQPVADHDPGTPETITWSLESLLPDAVETLLISVEVQFAAGGQIISTTAEITDSDAALVIGLTGEAAITISDSGSNLLTGGSGNCFIATAVYGSYLEPEVMVLRQFRDNFLLTNEPGRAFVAWYYRNSPQLANLIAANEPARTVTRILLSPIVYALKYPLLALLSLLLIGFSIRWGQRATRVSL